MSAFGGLFATVGLSDGVTASDERPSITENADQVLLQNSVIRVVFSKRTGGIVQIHDRRSDITLRDENGPEVAEAWTVSFYHEEYDDVTAKSSWGSNIPDFQVDEGDSKTSVTLEWSDSIIDSAAAPDSFKRKFDGTIRLSVSLSDENSGLHWGIQVDNNDDLQIKAIRAPYITNITSLTPNGSSELSLPISMGRRITNPTGMDHEWRIRYPSGFGTMQYSAYTAKQGGFYIQAEDKEGYIKQLVWGPQGSDNSYLEFYHEYDVSLDHASDVTLPYTVTMQPLRGDWHDAADTYTEWAESTGLLPENEFDIPPWYDKLGISISASSYTRSDEHPERQIPFEETVRKVIETQSALDVPTQMIWNGYQTHGKYGYGDWFPPKEGWAPFRKAISALQENEIAPAAFIGVTSLYERSDLWKQHSDADTWVIRGKNGEPKTTETMGFTTLEPHFYKEGWQAELSEVCRNWAEEGAKQIWLDGFPWGKAPNFSHRTCYAEEHNHPLGSGGKWWAHRSKQRLQEIKSDVTSLNNSILVSGEGISDFFLPEIDIQHCRDVLKEFRGGFYEKTEPIPLTQYALGDYVKVRGEVTEQLVQNYQSNTYIRLGLARALSWGAKPGFMVSVQRPEHDLFDEDQLEYATRIGRMFSIDATQFLTSGQIARKPSMESPEVEITVGMNPWGKEDRQIRRDALQVSGWKSKSGDQRAVILTNIHTEPITAQLDLGSTPFTSDEDRLYYSVRNGYYSRLEGESSSDSQQYTIDQDDVLMIVSSPPSDSRMKCLSLIENLQSELFTIDAFEEARRAFAKGQYRQCIDQLESLKSESATGNPTTSNEDKSYTTTPAPKSTDETTSATSPGFGMISALGSIIGAFALRRWIRDE